MRDPARVAVARNAIGSAGLFVDANGAYWLQRKRSISPGSSLKSKMCSGSRSRFHRMILKDFGECVTGHRPVIEIAAGEYGYSLDYFRRMLQAGAVDVQQADATRCGGVTGFLQAAALCEAHHADLSAHCAPALHLSSGLRGPRFRHLEWFHDHVRIEQHALRRRACAASGQHCARSVAPGLGLTLKQNEAERFAVGLRAAA